MRRKKNRDYKGREQRGKVTKEEPDYRSYLYVYWGRKASLKVGFNPAGGEPVRAYRPRFGLSCSLLQKSVGRTCPIDLRYRVDSER